MVSTRCKALFYICLIVCHDVLAVHHWRVSDDGKTIEAVHDSPYTLAYPGSLVDFLNQHESIKSFGQSYEELRKTLTSINIREKIDDPEIENRVRRDNVDCRAAGDFLMVTESFQTSYSPEFCPDFHVNNLKYVFTLIELIAGIKGKEKRPLCTAKFTKGDFPGEDKVKGLKNLRLTDRSPDILYEKILATYFHDYATYSKKESARFGHMLAELLNNDNVQVSGHPYLHMAAAAYLRIDGQLGAAMDCYRTAAKLIENPVVTLETDQFVKLRDALQIATVTLLTRSQHPEQAAGLIDWFRKAPQPDSGRAYCTLIMLHAASADIGAVSQETVDKQYNPSLVDFNEALKIEKDWARLVDLRGIPQWRFLMDSIEQKLGAMRCQLAITDQLEKQRDNLESLVNDKLYYNEIYGAQIKLEEQITGRMVSPEVRQNLRYGYDLVKYGNNPHLTCRSTIARRFPLSSNPNNIAGVLLCESKNQRAYDEFYLPLRKATLKNRPPLNDTAWRVAELFTRDRVFEKRLQQLAKVNGIDKPQMPVKYPISSAKKSAIKDRFWRRADWPNSVDCQAIISRSDIFNPSTMPQVFISPENKGFIVSDYLTKFLGLDHNEEHPLPWNEPYCNDVANISLHPLSTFKGVVEMLDLRYNSVDYAEPMLKTVLVRLADRIMDDIEIAQRVTTMMTSGIGPRWLALNLAGLYWRVKGNPRQATLCLIDAVMVEPFYSDIALSQLAQTLFKATGRREEAIHMLQMADGVDQEQPTIPWLQGRLSLFGLDVDAALRHLKEALDRDPFDDVISEDLLKVACSGKSSKPAISSQFPTVCCSSVVQNAVCFKSPRPESINSEKCYVVDSETSQLVYNRCNGVYTGVSYKTSPYANIVSPFLPIFQTVTKREIPPYVDDVGGVQTIDSVELPLDYGGSEAFFAARPAEWWSRAVPEMVYDRPSKADVDSWEEDVESNLADIPPKPLSFLWIKEKREMLRFDVSLPEVLPAPSMHQIRKGLSRFPPPRQTQSLCSGVNKLSVLLENQVSTWVSVTAKGEDIEKYVDLRGPVPGIAGLLPNCPSIDPKEGSPFLGLDHIPAFALSDQFLFYKPEKMLTDALKSLGNERDSIEHVAARLHTALLADGMGQNGKPVNWLLCVLSSLYWRVVGDAPKAVGCLRCALQTAPPQMRDVALVSLANMCHQAGLLHSALIAAGAALSVSPNLVAIHFTIANIYASIGDYQRALEFYYSTISLQSKFEPAKERIRAIYCHSGETFTFQAV